MVKGAEVPCSFENAHLGYRSVGGKLSHRRFCYHVWLVTAISEGPRLHDIVALERQARSVLRTIIPFKAACMTHETLVESISAWDSRTTYLRLV